MVEQVASRSYPRLAVSAGTVELAEWCLAADSLDTGVRRSMSDRTDDLQRVVASRDRFGR